MVVIGIGLHVSGGGMVESLVLLGVEKGGHGGRRRLRMIGIIRGMEMGSEYMTTGWKTRRGKR